MKSQNYQFEFMKSDLANKDVLYNEAIIKLDTFLNMSVVDFIDKMPESSKAGEKYIITGNANKGYIGYLPYDGKQHEHLKPAEGMIVFVKSEQSFYTFNDNQWQKLFISTKNEDSKVSSSNSKIAENAKFVGIQGDYVAPENEDQLYLYVNDDVTINLDKVKQKLLTIIVKQHYSQTKNITWPSNILWQGKNPHQLTATPNAMDIVRIYRMVESNHFFGEIVGQNYQF